MLNLFQGGDEAVGRRQSARRDARRPGVQDAKSLDGQPAVQAELYETLAASTRSSASSTRRIAAAQTLDQRRALFDRTTPR